MTLLALTCAGGCAPGADVVVGKDSAAGTDSGGDSGIRDSGTDTGKPDSDSPAHTGDSDEPPDSGEPCDDSDSAAEDGPDDDGDGYTDVNHGGDDCDDARAHVYPGAPDACDGLDQDCDGETIPPGACAEVLGPELSAWVTITGDEDHLDTRAVAPASPASAGGDAWLTWYTWGPLGRVSGLGGGPKLRDSAAPSPADWAGWWDEEDGTGWPAGDVDGDGISDLWQRWEPSLDPPGAYLLTLGPVPDRLCGVTYLWDLADAMVQVTDYEVHDSATMIDAGVDLDGDGGADALFSLGKWDGSGEYYLVGGPALVNSNGREIADTFPHVVRRDDGVGSPIGSPQLVPDVDGDGLGDLLFQYDCEESGGVSLLGGDEFSAAATATATINDLLEPTCGSTAQSDWYPPRIYELLPTDRATDADGDGYTDVVLFHSPGDGSEPESSLALVDLHDPGERALDDLVLRRLASLDDSPAGASTEFQGAYFAPASIDDRWLAMRYGGTCLYRVSDLPLGGIADKSELAAACMDDGDYTLEDIEDLDGDGLPEWIWSDSRYQVDGLEVGQVLVVLGFDVPYDDPSKW